MAGYTDAAMRSLCHEQGVGMTFTEMMNAEALVRGSRRTLHILETVPGEHPVGAHIYGHDADVMAAAAKMLEELDRFDCIDINCGCPVKKIVSKGNGAALMGNPRAIERIVSAVRAAGSLPVTVKTRLGLQPGKCTAADVIAAAENGGASAVFLHARYASQHHRGHVNWEAAVDGISKASIPVVYNGGLGSAEQAVRVLQETGAPAVMIGRAAIGNPWIFSDALSILRAKPVRKRTPSEVRSTILKHLALSTALMEKRYRICGHMRLPPGEVVVLRFKPQLSRYLAPYAGARAIGRQLVNVRTADDVRQLTNTALGFQ